MKIQNYVGIFCNKMKVCGANRIRIEKKRRTDVDRVKLKAKGERKGPATRGLCHYSSLSLSSSPPYKEDSRCRIKKKNSNIEFFSRRSKHTLF